MTIPGNLVAPIFTIELSAGGSFENQSRVLILGHKNGGAPLAADTPTPCPSAADARALAGAGSMLDDMVRMARGNAPAQEIWISAVPASGTAEQRTITINTVPAGGGQGVIEIAGEPVAVSIAAGASATTVATALAAVINGYFDPLSGASLPFTAAAAAAVVTLTARHAGVHSNEVDIFVPTLASVNAFDGNVTVAQAVPGSGAANIAASLAACGDEPFDWIVCPFNDDTNIGRLKDFLNETAGRWAFDRQIYGHAFYPKIDSIANLTTHALAQDNRHTTVWPLISGGGHYEPSWQWVAALVGRIAPLLSDGATGQVSINQTGFVLEGLRAPRDRTKWLNLYATRQAFNVSALSTWGVDGAGNIKVEKVVTTQRTINGVTNTTFRDIQKIGQVMYAFRKWRADMVSQHANKAIADDNPANNPHIVTTKDIEATWMHSYREMVTQGVLENPSQAAENTRATRNADNPNRVDLLGPADAVNPFDIFAANAQFWNQFRQ